MATANSFGGRGLSYQGAASQSAPSFRHPQGGLPHGVQVRNPAPPRRANPWLAKNLPAARPPQVPQSWMGQGAPAWTPPTPPSSWASQPASWEPQAPPSSWSPNPTGMATLSDGRPPVGSDDMEFDPGPVPNLSPPADWGYRSNTPNPGMMGTLAQGQVPVGANDMGFDPGPVPDLSAPADWDFRSNDPNPGMMDTLAQGQPPVGSLPAIPQVAPPPAPPQSFPAPRRQLPPGYVLGPMGATPEGMEPVGMRNGQVLYAPVSEVYSRAGQAPIGQVRDDYQLRNQRPRQNPYMPSAGAPQAPVPIHQQRAEEQRRRIAAERERFIRGTEDHSRLMVEKAERARQMPGMEALEQRYGRGNVPPELAWGLPGGGAPPAPTRWVSR